MNFIADENIDHSIVLRLRELGHDVLSASESLATSTDEKLLEPVSKPILTE